MRHYPQNEFMCGILGYCDTDQDVNLKQRQLQDSLSKLSHRGPDGAGEYFWNHVYFGHRRLSIIDLSEAANQPFHFFEEKVAIVFNGEIYNYKELALQLPSLRTASDTEVILRGYLLWGIAFFKQLRGIFAFAIYDYREGQSIVLYRDLAGVKPLYYVHERNRFAFASEIKAFKDLFLLQRDESVLRAYLAIGYCPEPMTAYKNVRCCQPGECITFDLRQGKLHCYLLNGYDFTISNNNSFAENVRITRGLLRQAVQRNLVADVSLSVSLSGGIDSSLVAANSFEQEVKLLTVKFDDQAYDESMIAKRYARELERAIEVIHIKKDSDLALLDRLLLHFDQPYSDTSAIPFYFLCREAARGGKVLLGGDGGDEVHGGYSSFGWLPLLWKVRKMTGVLNRPAQAVLRGSRLRNWNRVQGLVGFNSPAEVICELSSWLPTSTRFDDKPVFLFDTDVVFDVFRQGWIDFHHSFSTQMVYGYFFKRMLSDYLRKADMMSMINGLEYRVPMLDEDFVRFGLTIPFSQRCGMFEQKKVLRAIHKTSFSGGAYKRPKSGFAMPVDKWLKREDFEIIESRLLGKQAEVKEYVRPEYIKFLFLALNSDQTEQISRASVYQRIIQLYSFQLFCEGQ